MGTTPRSDESMTSSFPVEVISVFLTKPSASNPYSLLHILHLTLDRREEKKKNPFWLWIAQRINVEILHETSKALSYQFLPSSLALSTALLILCLPAWQF